MDHLKEASPLLLAKGSAITRTDATSTIIRCQVGSLWITQDNDVRDVVLEAGGLFRPDRKGAVVVYALAASRVSWASVQPSAPSSWRAFFSRFVQRLVSSVESRHPAIE